MCWGKWFRPSTRGALSPRRFKAKDQAKFEKWNKDMERWSNEQAAKYADTWAHPGRWGCGPRYTGAWGPMWDKVREAVPTGYRVHQDANQYSISMDVPGVKPDDVKIELLNNGTLVVSGGRRETSEGNLDTNSSTESDRYYAMEFDYEIDLDDADRELELEKLRAKMTDGVLKISVPWKEEIPKPDKQVRSIPIEYSSA